MPLGILKKQFNPSMDKSKLSCASIKVAVTPVSESRGTLL